MTGVTDICNLALGRIKQGSITDVDDGSAEADECGRLYPLARDYVLADFPWRVNTVLQSLTPLTNDRPDDWEYKYQRPTCLRFVEIMPETGRRAKRQRIRFEQNSAGLYCNHENARAVVLTQETDTTLYSPAIVSLIAWRLAYELVGPLEADGPLMQWAQRKYANEKAEAQTTDASEFIEQDDDAGCASGGDLPTMILCRE